MDKRKRLLILSCSARKSNAELAPAIERYQSPVFFVLRRFLRNHPNVNLVVWILSAKYGLIPTHRLTINYDQAMTAERAGQLRQKIENQFRHLKYVHFGKTDPDVFCHLPKTYLDALDRQITELRKYGNLQIADGRPGEKSQQLKNWLEGVNV